MMMMEDVLQWTREMWMQFLKEKHRQAIPYTASATDSSSKYQLVDDVWKALQNLDRGSTDATVQLIYSQRNVPYEPHGTMETWNREHLWPQSRYYDDDDSDFNPEDSETFFLTDLHHLRPADSNINEARGNIFWHVLSNELYECSRHTRSSQ
jgi:endonuclease I